jgi:hypothetical protein
VWCPYFEVTVPQSEHEFGLAETQGNHDQNEEEKPYKTDEDNAPNQRYYFFRTFSISMAIGRFLMREIHLEIISLRCQEAGKNYVKEMQNEAHKC